MRGQQVDQVFHAQQRVRRVFAVGETHRQVLEGIKGVTHGLGIALTLVQRHDLAQQPQVLREEHQALQIVDVVDAGMVGVLFDEAVAGGDGRIDLALLVIGVGEVQFRLLGKAAERIARLKLFVVLDGRIKGALVKLVLGLTVEALRAPADSFVLLLVENAAAREQQRKNEGE